MKKTESGPERCQISPMRAVGLSVFCGTVALLLTLTAFSAMLSARDSSPAVRLPMAIAAMLCGGLAAGYLCGRLLRRGGMLYGFFCGAALFFLTFLLEYLLIGGDTSALLLYKLAAYAVAGMIGGILGVNKKGGMKKAKLRKK